MNGNDSKIVYSRAAEIQRKVRSSSVTRSPQTSSLSATVKNSPKSIISEARNEIENLKTSSLPIPQSLSKFSNAYALENSLLTRSSKDELNKRLASSLFFRKLDAEEIESMFIFEKSDNNNSLITQSPLKKQVFEYPSSSTYKVEFAKKSLVEESDHNNNKKKDLKPYDESSYESLSQNEIENYFGDYARVGFFDQYRKLSMAKQLISATATVDNYFNDDTLSSSTGAESTRDYSASRLNRQASRADNNNNSEANENRVLMSAKSVRFSFDDRSQSSTDKNSSDSINSLLDFSMSRTCEEFYSEVQSLACQEDLHESIDSEILSHNSFNNYKQQFNQYMKQSKNISNSLQNDKKPKIYGKKNKNKKYKKIKKPNRLPALATIGGEDFEEEDTNYTNNTYNNEECVQSIVSSIENMSFQQPLISPRTKYISGCIRDGLKPFPNLILRKNVTNVINLSHYVMGDRMGRVLAECLEDLPLIESINLNDNNLTDESLKHLLSALVNIRSLHTLDLSRNKIDGDSSDALAEYVSRSDCPLRKLILQSADVDDGECDGFVKCLMTNKMLLELDMSSNLLGTAENMTSDDPDFKTGPVSIANYLKSECCTLQILKLSWNSIRLNSAVVLANSLAYNKTLTYLDISCNGLGWMAGEALGDALMENRVLKTLIISNNGFTSSAVMCICIGIIENLAMKYINLDENPIGEAGAKAILQLSVVVGNRITVSAARCNTIAHDERCWYDPGKPCREYELELKKPFDRSVAFHLMQLIASHSTYIFTNVYYENDKGKSIPLKLVQSVATDRENYFDDDQKAVIGKLRLLKDAASNMELGKQMFLEADADGSGKLDKFELKDVLENIGLDIDEEQLQDIFAVFDIDGEGAIDFPEFQNLLRSQAKEATSRIHDMTQYPIMTYQGKRYIPPRSGVLRLQVVDGFIRKQIFYTMSTVDTKYAHKMAKGIGDMTMMAEATTMTKTRFSEAFALYKTMYKEIGDKAAVLLKVVPNMLSPHEARQLMAKATNEERLEVNRVKLAFGLAYRPMFGSYNGYYMLDLSKETHRMCFAKLIEVSGTTNNIRASKSIVGYGKVGDVSQHGNWTSFRNEIYNGEQITITAKRFTPMPRTGVLEFDFSGGPRPVGGELRLSDRRLCNVLENLSMIKPGESKVSMKRLMDWRKRTAKKSKDGKMNMPMYEFPVAKALEVGTCVDSFYDNLSSRGEMQRKGSKREEIRFDFMSESRPTSRGNNDLENSDLVDGNENNDNENDYQIDSEEVQTVEDSKSLDHSIPPEEESSKKVDDEVAVIIKETEGNEDEDDGGVVGEEVGGDTNDEEKSLATQSSHEPPSGDVALMRRQKKIAEIKDRYSKLLNTKKGISKFAKANRFVDLLDEQFSQLWILARHLGIIVVLFQELFGDSGRSKYFGSYVVDVVVMLFQRVVDLHNLELLWEVLDESDCAAVFCRLGYLNVFNPMKADVTLELNLERREERQLAKMVVYLSVDEPGINITYKRFQWKRELDPTPGWELTEAWVTDSGMADHGYFGFTYYSGGGMNNYGCIPNLFLRRALCALVLIDENELADEDDVNIDEYQNSAAKHFNDNREIWSEYLVPGCDSFTAKKK